MAPADPAIQPLHDELTAAGSSRSLLRGLLRLSLGIVQSSPISIEPLVNPCSIVSPIYDPHRNFHPPSQSRAG